LASLVSVIEGTTMLLSDVMAIVFSVLGFLLAFQGLWLLARAVWPAAVLAAADDCDRALWRPFVVGLPVAVVIVVAAARLMKGGGPGGIAGIALLSIFVLASSIGVAGLCTLLGRRLNNGQTSVKTMILGGVALEMAFVFPLVGWFAVLPITLVIGCGATCRGLLAGRKRAVVANLSTPPAADSVTSAGMMK
jgi:hypothetical protein